MRKNGILQRAYSACTSAEIRRHQHAGVIHKVASMSKLAHVVELAHLNSTMEKICIYGKSKRVFTIS